MQAKVIGGGTLQPGVELGIDPTFLAARVAIKPLDYAMLGDVLGHYRAAFSTSTIAPAGSSQLATVRWADSSRFFVLMRVVLSITVVTAVTAQRTDPISLRILRKYTARETTNITAVNLSGDNQKLRSPMMESSLVDQMGASSAAAGISGGTSTLDNQPIAFVGLTGITGLGTGVQNIELYKWDSLGQHPVVLSRNEGLACSWGTTALATGTVTVNFIFEWAEVSVF